MHATRIPQLLVTAIAVSAALAAGSIAHAKDGDFEWPRLLVVATPGTGSGSFASTNGWAPILQKEMGTTVRVVPEDNEPQRYRRLTDRKDVAISSVSQAEIRFQTEGIGGYAGLKPVAQRVLWHHNDTPWGFVVAGDSEIKTMADLKKGNVRVAQGMFSPPMGVVVRDALPAFLNMSAAEVESGFTYVPASNYNENCRSVVEGKVDVAYCAAISSVLSEMEGAPGGIRWLPMTLSDTEAWARYLVHRPMLIPSKISMGVSSARDVDGVISNFVYSVPADTDEAFAYNMAKWIHTSFDAYKGTHPLATRMSLEHFREYLNRTPLPVHEGTIKYLREINAWTAEDDAWNNEAIAKTDKWIAARKKGLEEAAKAGVKADFNDEKFMAIMSKATEGLEGFRTRL